MESLEQRVERIEARNAAVEGDKAWEVSNARKILIAVFTFFIIGFYLQAVGVHEAWTHALVGTLGFMVSTLSMPFFRRAWVRYIWKRK